jgi:hypothetical protein
MDYCYHNFFRNKNEKLKILFSSLCLEMEKSLLLSIVKTTFFSHATE